MSPPVRMLLLGLGVVALLAVLWLGSGSDPESASGTAAVGRETAGPPTAGQAGARATGSERADGTGGSGSERSASAGRSEGATGASARGGTGTSAAAPALTHLSGPQALRTRIENDPDLPEAERERLLRAVDEMERALVRQQAEGTSPANEVEEAEPKPLPDRSMAESDADWDQMLYEAGQRNRLVVRRVVDLTPAASAGFQAGDQIIRYDGERIFTRQDLAAASASAAGDVVVDVIRNGETVSLRVPSGPLASPLDWVSAPPIEE